MARMRDADPFGERLPATGLTLSCERREDRCAAVQVAQRRSHGLGVCLYQGNRGRTRQRNANDA